MNSYVLPEDELVLRRLAKKLEIANYKTRPINHDFTKKLPNRKWKLLVRFIF